MSDNACESKLEHIQMNAFQPASLTNVCIPTELVSIIGSEISI